MPDSPQERAIGEEVGNAPPGCFCFRSKGSCGSDRDSRSFGAELVHFDGCLVQHAPQDIGLCSSDDHAAEISLADGKSRAVRIKTMATADRDYVMSKWMEKSDDLLGGVSDPKVKEALGKLKKLAEAIEKAGKK